MSNTDELETLNIYEYILSHQQTAMELILKYNDESLTLGEFLYVHNFLKLIQKYDPALFNGILTETPFINQILVNKFSDVVSSSSSIWETESEVSSQVAEEIVPPIDTSWIWSSPWILVGGVLAIGILTGLVIYFKKKTNNSLNDNNKNNNTSLNDNNNNLENNPNFVPEIDTHLLPPNNIIFSQNTEISELFYCLSQTLAISIILLILLTLICWLYTKLKRWYCK